MMRLSVDQSTTLCVVVLIDVEFWQMKWDFIERDDEGFEQMTLSPSYIIAHKVRTHPGTSYP